MRRLDRAEVAFSHLLKACSLTIVGECFDCQSPGTMDTVTAAV